MRYKAIVSYDGSNYAGWQKQSNALGIQEIIEKALKKMHNKEIDIISSGRTDAHVHAYEQVFHFDSEMDIDSDHWRMALNTLLPKDIRIQEVNLVSDNFHARFDVMSKRYDYFITHKVNDPFLENYMAKERLPLDVEYMRICAQTFIGTHDFTSFTSNKIHPEKSRIKTITRLDILEEQGNIHMIYEGSGFLRYMVRMITQTLIEAGKHKLDAQQIQTMLDEKSKYVCHYKASANGLYLMKVTYKD